MWTRYRPCIIATALLLTAAAGCTTGPQRQPGLADGIYTVARVIDGDTVELANVGRLRFVRFNAPELGEPGGEEMASHLQSLAEGQDVYVTFQRRRRDGMPARCYYGRLLGTIWIPAPRILDDQQR